MPGTAKIFSTTREPVTMYASIGPKYVMTGISEFFSACPKMIFMLETPFALAVRI